MRKQITITQSEVIVPVTMAPKLAELNGHAANGGPHVEMLAGVRVARFPRTPSLERRLIEIGLEELMRVEL